MHKKIASLSRLKGLCTWYLDTRSKGSLFEDTPDLYKEWCACGKPLENEAYRLPDDRAKEVSMPELSLWTEFVIMVEHFGGFKGVVAKLKEQGRIKDGWITA